METNQAAEHLQVIRTLMERSAVYRRALAPIMTFCGVVGIVAGIAGWQLKINSVRGFVLFWSAVAATALLGSLLLVRRQALKDAEPFWSPPTRRVAQAMALPLIVGMFAGIVIAFGVQAEDPSLDNCLTMIWAWLYACALHSAGFFISRGIRVLGWIYGAIGCALLVSLVCLEPLYLQPHLLMAGVFGALHLVCGIYLYFSENRRNET
jgi:hypothetical protein